MQTLDIKSRRELIVALHDLHADSEPTKIIYGGMEFYFPGEGYGQTLPILAEHKFRKVLKRVIRGIADSKRLWEKPLKDGRGEFSLTPNN